MNVFSHVDSQVDRPDRRNEMSRRHVRIFPDILRIKSQKQLRHRRISGDDQVGNQGAVDPAHVQQLLDDPVDGRDNHLLQLLQSPGSLGVYNPGDHILSVTDLGIVIRGFGQGEQRGPSHWPSGQAKTTHSLRLRI